MSTNLEALGLTAFIAALYLLVLRVVDANEREPVWCLLFVLHLGIASAIFLRLTVSDVTLEMTLVRSALARQAATLIAFLIGVRVLSAVSRLRGWSELTDVMDGLVYGAAAGLGVALGETAFRELMRPTDLVMSLPFSAWRFAADAALNGLASGVTGALIGIGFGAAIDMRGRVVRFMYGAAGFLAAVGAQIAREWMARGNTLAGASALTRAWIALLAPVFLVAIVAWHSRRREQRAIQAELAGEMGDGTVAAHDLDLLRHHLRRQWSYAAALATPGGFHRATLMAALHNRQVQLALAKRRMARAADPALRDTIASEIAALRAAIGGLRGELSR